MALLALPPFRYYIKTMPKKTIDYTLLKSGRYRPEVVRQAEATWQSMGRRRSFARMTEAALVEWVANRAEQQKETT